MGSQAPEDCRIHLECKLPQRFRRRRNQVGYYHPIRTPHQHCHAPTRMARYQDSCGTVPTGQTNGHTRNNHRRPHPCQHILRRRPQVHHRESVVLHATVSFIQVPDQSEL